MQAIQAIETEYRGHRFRSRLEARWAVFMHTAGVRYEYEPEGFVLKRPDGERWLRIMPDGPIAYLPDFWLPELGCWLEIKPWGDDGGPQDYAATLRCNLLAMQSGKPAAIILGSPPALDDMEPAGPMIEARVQLWAEVYRPKPEWGFSETRPVWWGECHACRKTVLGIRESLGPELDYEDVLMCNACGARANAVSERLARAIARARGYRFDRRGKE